MENNIFVDISPPISYLAKSWSSSYGPKRCQQIKLQDSLKCNISRKKWIMKFVFAMQINIEVFYNLILSFWVCATRHAQSTQNKKFTYPCNISRKAWNGGGGGGVKLIFCQQVNTKVFYKLIVSQSSQNSKSVMSLQYLIKKVKDEVDSLHADKHQSFLKVYFNTLGIRVS